MLMENANYMAALKYINPEYFNTKYHEFFKNIKLDPTYRQGILPY
jgi:hypothetical protein